MSAAHGHFSLFAEAALLASTWAQCTFDQRSFSSLQFGMGVLVQP